MASSATARCFAIPHRRDSTITITSQVKLARGTKRLCQACEVRFYDLTRDPVVCPMCGAQQDSVAARILHIGKPVAGQRSKTSWRSRPSEPPKPALPVEAQPDADSDAVPEASADENLVLEQDEDEGDVADLVERDGGEAKDA